MAGTATIRKHKRAGGSPEFRLDNERLAFRFTATLSDRGGTPTERLPDPGRLDDWLSANDLRLGNEHAAPEHLELARNLREAIHRLGTAIVHHGPPPPADLVLINTLAQENSAFPELTKTGMRWRSPVGDPVRAVLGLIAQDAVVVLGGADRSRVKTCENPDCSGLYVDTSQARNRRWCSMNICGNRAKKAKFRHGKRS